MDFRAVGILFHTGTSRSELPVGTFLVLVVIGNLGSSGGGARSSGGVLIALKVRRWRNKVRVIDLIAVSDEIAVIKMGLNGGLTNFQLNPWIFLACCAMAQGHLVL